MTNNELSREYLKLARLFSVDRSYYDIWGNCRQCSEETLVKALSAMGIVLDDEKGAVERVVQSRRKDLLSQLLAPVQVVEEGVEDLVFVLTVPELLTEERVEWCFTYEDGACTRGNTFLKDIRQIRQIECDGERYFRYRFDIRKELPLGYHSWYVRIGSAEEGSIEKGVSVEGTCQVIVVPDKCYQPTGFVEQKRYWGIAAQLYSVKTETNWGIGQYTDISKLVDLTSDAGGAFLGLNPFNSVALYNPHQNSPYCTTSRSFLNVYYLDCEAIVDVQESKEAQNLLSSSEYQSKIASLRETEQVQYVEIRAIKNAVFEIAYEYFLSSHVSKETERAIAFKKFVKDGGVELEHYAVYEAIGSQFWKPDGSCWGWPVWKKELRDCDSNAVAEFADENRDEIDYFKYLQWQAHVQLTSVIDACDKSNMSLGLYVDFALSGDKGGCDVWRDKKVYAVDASIGAPPDEYNPKGQNWGFAPPIPHILQASAYDVFIEPLRANMKYAGAMRIDHAMAMMRLYWILPDSENGEGVYVQYPVRDLMGILCLESVRNKCVIVCEDLGTVPDSFRVLMREYQMLAYKVFFFMKCAPTEFLRPHEYPEDSLVTGTTHDMHTLWGYWQGLDLTLRHSLELLPGVSLEEHRNIREEEKRNLLQGLLSEGLLPEKFNIEEALLVLGDEVVIALQQYMARTPCRLFVTPIEDIAGQIPQVNLPGTTDELYPSWKHRLPITLSEIAKLDRYSELKKVIAKEKRAIT